MIIIKYVLFTMIIGQNNIANMKESRKNLLKNLIFNLIQHPGFT